MTAVKENHCTEVIAWEIGNQANRLPAQSGQKVVDVRFAVLDDSTELNLFPDTVVVQAKKNQSRRYRIFGFYFCLRIVYSCQSAWIN